MLTIFNPQEHTLRIIHDQDVNITSSTLVRTVCDIMSVGSINHSEGSVYTMHPDVTYDFLAHSLHKVGATVQLYDPTLSS